MFMFELQLIHNERDSHFHADIDMMPIGNVHEHIFIPVRICIIVCISCVHGT